MEIIPRITFRVENFPCLQLMGISLIQ
jgi:hypothetical protein